MPAVTHLNAIRHTLAHTGAACHIDMGNMPAPHIIAVSKTRKTKDILPLLEAGHRLFGENRVQEAKEKWIELKAQFPDVTLHLIGPLQTNKVKEALALFDVIETLDRPKLAHVSAKERKETDITKAFYIQVNTGEEQQKAGIAPLEADDFIHLCRDELGLPVTGLMCIPPSEEEPALHFGLLRTIAERNNLPNLSMGMSNDFETAAAMGATHIRLGTAIFGARE